MRYVEKELENILFKFLYEFLEEQKNFLTLTEKAKDKLFKIYICIIPLLKFNIETNKEINEIIFLDLMKFYKENTILSTEENLNFVYLIENIEYFIEEPIDFGIEKLGDEKLIEKISSNMIQFVFIAFFLKLKKDTVIGYIRAFENMENF